LVYPIYQVLKPGGRLLVIDMKRPVPCGSAWQ
jgi:hypothetical protein